MASVLSPVPSSPVAVTDLDDLDDNDGIAGEATSDEISSLSSLSEEGDVADNMQPAGVERPVPPVPITQTLPIDEVPVSAPQEDTQTPTPSQDALEVQTKDPILDTIRRLMEMVLTAVFSAPSPVRVNCL